MVEIDHVVLPDKRKYFVDILDKDTYTHQAMIYDVSWRCTTEFGHLDIKRIFSR